MPTPLDLIGLGMSPSWANELGNAPTDLTTTGTTQATAAVIRVTNVTLRTDTGATGAVLQSRSLVGTPYYINNPSAVDGIVYPPGSDTINGAASITIPQNKSALIWKSAWTTWNAIVTEEGAGTVTSVALALPNIFTVSGSPVTTSGTLTGTLATQLPNLVWASSSSGATAAPTFRAIVSADLPATISTAAATLTGLATTRSGTATPVAASAVAALAFGSAAIGIYWGTGDPSATAPKGSLYIKADGSGIADRLWINTNGTTGWTNFVTAA